MLNSVGLDSAGGSTFGSWLVEEAGVSILGEVVGLTMIDFPP